MATTYEKIASVTVGSGGAASIDFTSIPATFDDLVIKLSARFTSINSRNRLKFNNSGGTAYSERMIYGDGTNAVSTSLSNNSSIEYIYSTNQDQTASTFSNNEIYIPNYAGSTNKSVSIDGVFENNATYVIINFDAGLWANTAAITSIKLEAESGSVYVQHSSASLYGIKKS